MATPETVQSLENILTRLALTNDTNLPKVLWKLIPGVIRQLQFPDAALRNKVLQILSHANQRLDADVNLQLPLLELVAVLREADANQHSMVRSLALVYIEKATARSSVETRLAVVSQLLTGVANRPLDQRTLLMRFAVSALADRRPTPSESAKKQKTDKDVVDPLFQFLCREEDRKAFLEFASWTLLYQTRQRVSAQKELILDGHPLELAPSEMTVLKDVPSGLSLEMAQAVQGRGDVTAEQLQERKLGLLEFLKDAYLGDAAFEPYLIASADPVEAVSKLGEALLKKHFRIEADSKDLDLNHPERIHTLLALFLGSLGERVIPTAQNVSSFVTPAAPGLKAKLLGVLVKSTEAANHYPLNIQIVWSCVFGRHVPMTLRLQAMEFSVWIVKHATSPILHQIAEPLLMKLLEMMKGETSATQRGYIYEALSQLAEKQPSVFQNKLWIAEEMLSALENEPPGVRSQLQVAMASLSGAFNGADVAVQELLMKSICFQSSAVRLVAVAWSLRLFPFEAPLARYICIVGAADERPEVQSEAQLGLDPTSFKREATSHSSSATFPSVPAFLAFLKAHAIQATQKVYPRLIQFLRKCHLEADSADQTLNPEVLMELLALYEAALTPMADTALVIELLEALVSLITTNRAAMADWASQRMALLKEWLYHTSHAVRVPCAQLMGLGGASMPPCKAAQLIEDLKEPLIAQPKAKFEVRSGSVQAIGYLTAACRNGELLKALDELTHEVLILVLTEGDPHLASTTALCISHQILNPAFPAALVPEGSFVDWFGEQVCGKILTLCKNQDLRVATRAVLATGLLSKGLAEPELQEKCLHHLISLQSLKNEELQCLVGEALALGFARETISSDWILICNFTCLRELPLDLDALETPTVPEAVHRGVVDGLLAGMSHSRPENRAACASHLVTLLTYCPRHPCLLAKLESAQNAFLGLLGDKNGLTQEMASRGVSLVYRLGDAQMKSTLLSGLTSVLKDPNKRGTAVKVEADTEVFAEGELGPNRTGNSGNLMTYRELCSIANDMGQPELLYKFMDLAHHRASLQSRRGAAVGFGHIAEIAGEDLKPYLTTLLPRIYRLRFDPSPVVQETMQNIWQSLVPEDSTALDTHLNLILKELMTEIASRLWRHRESSSRALCELLQGRKWSQLQPHFAEIWRMAFRVADDIKESVRVAGVQLMKAMKRSTLRFGDPHVMEPTVVADVVEIALPVLLEVLQRPKVAETVALSFSTLSSLTSNCPETLLRPHLPLLIPALLDGLSNLESKQLEQLEAMAGDAGVDSERVESLRVRLSHQSPIQDVLQRCLRAVDASVLDALMPKLREVIQRGVGLNTRVGTARFVAQLTSPLGSDLAPYASKLLKLYLTKALGADSSVALKKAYSSTIGALCRVASTGVVQKVVQQCREELKQEGISHKTVAQIFRELHSQAPSQFADQAGSIVPLAFVMRYEEQSENGIWGTLLEEGIGTESGALRLYHDEILLEVTQALESSRWSSRAAAARAIGRLYTVDPDLMAPDSVVLTENLLEQLSGRMWDGKEAILDALAQICRATPTALRGMEAALVGDVVAACSRGKKEFKEAALSCLAAAVKHLGDRAKLYTQVMPFLLTAAQGSLSDEEAGTKLPFVGVMQCIANARSGLDVDLHDAECFALFGEFLTAPRPWHLKNAVLQSLTTFLNDSQFAPETLPRHLTQLVTGTFVCLEEQKYEQLRLSALETLTAVTAAAKRHSVTNLDSTLTPRLEQHLQNERSLTVKLKAELLIGTLKSASP